MSEWIVIPNWDKFQHYKDRNPAWIKVYTDLSSRDEWRQLGGTERGILVSLWIEYARFAGQLRVENVAAITGLRVRQKHLASLNDAGFIEVSASRPLAPSRALARDREETETETPKSSFQKTGDNPNAQRRKAKAWIDNVLPHLEGVDLAYTIADEFHIDDQDVVADLISYAQERMLSRTL